MPENQSIPDTDFPLQPTMRLAWKRTVMNVDAPEAFIDQHEACGHRYVLCQWWDGGEEGGEWRKVPIVGGLI